MNVAVVAVVERTVGETRSISGCVALISFQQEWGGGWIKPMAMVKMIHERIAIIKMFFAWRKRVETTLQNGAEMNSTNGLNNEKKKRETR